MKHRTSEKYDICEFCEALMGKDLRDSCATPCICAAYANQDYVSLREKTIGLPHPRSLKMPEAVEPKPYWESLTDIEKEKVAHKMGDLSKKLDPILRDMVTLLIQGCTRKEICESLKIEEEYYGVYLDRIRRISEANEPET